MFRNFLDSDGVVIQPDVTCLVGKNESGKSAFLEALYRLNPTRDTARFSVQDDYPAWREKQDRRGPVTVDEVAPITAELSLEGDESTKVSERFGSGALESGGITLSRDYSGTLHHSVHVNERAFVAHVVDSIDWPYGTKAGAKSASTVHALLEYGEQLRTQEGADEGKIAVAERVSAEIQSRLGGKSLEEAMWSVLETMIPKFLYWSQISELPYSAKIERVLKTDAAQLSEAELTMRSLLRIGGTDDEYLLNADYERRKRELENVANALTSDVLEYWSQNRDLRVFPDLTQTTESDPNGRRAVIDEIKLRIYDDRHRLSLPFNSHSTGFRWFFSFLAEFFPYEQASVPVVILLDEPALGLHARAQADYLRFIDERLAASHQVVYSTHSPFMVQPGRLERVRTIEDKGIEVGAKVSSDVAGTDPDTLFPLQGALGYDLAQHLFVSAHNLVVEGTCDYTYLRVMSDFFAEGGERESLNDKWSIVPVGGADLVPTFVALLGNHLDVTVVVDASKKGHQKLNSLVNQGLLEDTRVITIGKILGRTEAEIEDLFAPTDYVPIVNAAFGWTIDGSALSGTDSIVRQIARDRGLERFDHGKPADLLLRRRESILPALSAETLNRFEALFKRVNRTLV